MFKRAILIGTIVFCPTALSAEGIECYMGGEYSTGPFTKVRVSDMPTYGIWLTSNGKRYQLRYLYDESTALRYTPKIKEDKIVADELNCQIDGVLASCQTDEEVRKQNPDKPPVVLFSRIDRTGLLKDGPSTHSEITVDIYNASLPLCEEGQVKGSCRLTFPYSTCKHTD